MIMSDCKSPEEEYLNNETIEDVNYVLNSLSEKEKDILIAIEVRELRLEEIGEKYSVCRERIRQIGEETKERFIKRWNRLNSMKSKVLV